ncbi:MAG TPA: SIS domain-containing protein [Bryobacteraceae bacterium]
MSTTTVNLAHYIEEAFAARNALFERFFAQEAGRLAEACREMSERFLKGGRLLAFGKGPYATDAQHVSVEFVHPVIVGKRALPALDVSHLFRPWLEATLQPEDMVMGFGPPEGEDEIHSALRDAAVHGAMTFALPGDEGSYALRTPTTDPFVHQELVEILYHTLWETVHVFFEHRELGQDAGAASFLYPFLGGKKQDTQGIVDEVADSIRMKVREDAKLREQVAQEEADGMVGAAAAIGERLRRGGKLILFGNGGSATDANDWAIDCFFPPAGYVPIPAVSLSVEPANITALANDVGVEVIFLRQLIAQARPDDVAVGISTSGGSKNVIAALEEARKRGMLTVGLLGYDGGEIVRRGLVDHPLVVRSDYVPRIQEVQASMYHTIRDLMEKTRHAGS